MITIMAVSYGIDTERNPCIRYERLHIAEAAVVVYITTSLSLNKRWGVRLLEMCCHLLKFVINPFTDILFGGIVQHL